MTTFLAYASAFETYPEEGEASESLSPLLMGLERIAFTLRVDDPSINQGQMASDFDEALEQAILAAGAQSYNLTLPREIPQELDFAFTYRGRTVAVEIEKANREKILRDVLKCHMYLDSGANLALVVLPRNYPHSHGIWDLFDFGCQRFKECQKYGFGTPAKLGRILLLGFKQFDAETNRPLCTKTRKEMRKYAENH